MKNYYESSDLTSKEDIIAHFEDVGRSFLKCGQGEYEEETSLVCKIGEDFFTVYLSAEIASSRQDIGDRLYFVDYISDVKFDKWSKERIEREFGETRKLERGDKFKHYKGGVYEFVCIAKNTETEEDYVIYQDSMKEVWARPKDMFFSKVDFEGESVLRFTRI